ncbi:nuclear transport factor 2 family protein [Novosphingobium bradum]|uniref:Nuclear transport factor 2 family protein n=1 Tax=Novosphingobium bradum TaxID=1737444 RepID=A0ABV7ITW3_9SPHN
MTLDELLAREAIRDCLARISQAGDAKDYATYVACFTPDGELTFGEATARTREGIRAQMERTLAARVARGATMVRHSVTSTVIRLAGPDRAEVHSYFHVYGVAGPDHFGEYVDQFARHEGEWRLARRRIGVDWVSPFSRHSRTG